MLTCLHDRMQVCGYVCLGCVCGVRAESVECVLCLECLERLRGFECARARACVFFACVCMRVPASTGTARDQLVSSPSLTVLHLSINQSMKRGETPTGEGPDLPYLPRHGGRPSKNNTHLVRPEILLYTPPSLPNAHPAPPRVGALLHA